MTNIKQQRNAVLSGFSIEELSNPITLQSIREKLETLDWLIAYQWRVVNEPLLPVS